MYPLILQLDVAGVPRKWINYEKASSYYSKNCILWESGVNHTILHGGINKKSNKQSLLLINSIVSIKNKKGRVFKNDKKVCINNTILFRRDGSICAYCGLKYTHNKLTRDHVYPKTLGGMNTWTNLLTACKSCNANKGQQTLSQLNKKPSFLPYDIGYIEYLFLSNLNMTDDQYQFLIKLIPNHSRIHDLYKRDLQG